jgi:glycosyltransferase involved in cell wall biosynthesis
MAGGWPNGFVVKAGETEALGEKIGFLLANPQVAETMGRQARGIAERRFSCEQHVDELLSLFQKAITDHERSGIHAQVHL